MRTTHHSRCCVPQQELLALARIRAPDDVPTEGGQMFRARPVAAPRAWCKLRRRLSLVLALALIGSSLALAPATRAASIIVTTLSDTVDADDCNTLTPVSLPGTDHLVSLREAICAA